MRSLFVKRGDTVTVTQPNTLVIPRDDRGYPPVHQPRVHERVVSDVDGQTAPQPVPYSSFNSVGRVTTARWHDQLLAISDKLSIRASESAGSALVQRIPGAVVVQRGTALGGQVPFTERADIEAPAQTTYGALATMRPAQLSALAYRKLMG